ncbi:MAG: U32 family peptidase [Candidatus Omnitrophica bacterium]|nr:U32 family peptidase [Candidatus Omnitrophota bacterium]
MLPLIEAGADEFFCGIFERDWTQEYSHLGGPNRRYCPHGSFGGTQAFKEAVRTASEQSAGISLALNESYSQPQLDWVLEQIRQLAGSGLKSCIVADPGLIHVLRKEFSGDFEIHLSLLSGVLNSDGAKLYRDLGVSRVILPRHLALAEIATLVRKVPDLDFEILVMNTRCKNVDAFCTFQHGLGVGKWFSLMDLRATSLAKAIVNQLPLRVSEKIDHRMMRASFGCCLDYDISPLSGASEDWHKRWTKPVQESLSKSLQACGLCNLGDLRNAGVSYLKIAGREYSLSRKLQAVRMVKQGLAVLETQSPEEHESKMRRIYQNHYGNDCERRYCYYA